MRPHDRSVRSKATSLARARMHLNAGLGWIRGYPRGARGGTVEWVSVPAPGTGRDCETVTIDREAIRAGALAHRKLLRRHSGSLERIFDDAAAWSAGVEQRLEALKAVIHGGEPLAGLAALLEDAAPAVRRTARTTAAAWPVLAPLLTAVAWIHCDAPKGRTKAVRFVAGRAEGLAALLAGPPERDDAAAAERFEAALRLIDLAAADGEPRVAAVARALTDPRAFTVAQSAPHGIPEAVERQLRKKHKRPALVWPDRADPELGPALLQAVRRLAPLPDGRRRRALQLLGLVTPRHTTRRWEQWWRSVDRAVAAVERRVQPVQPEAGRIADLRRHFHTLRRLARTRPPALPMHLMCATALALTAEDEDEKFFRELVRGLRAMPEMQGRFALRAGFFQHWTGLRRSRRPAGAILRRAMTASRGLLRDGRFPERILNLWSHIPDQREPSSWDLSRSPEGVLAHGQLPAGHLGRLYRFVEMAAWGGRDGEPLHIKDANRWSAALLLLEAGATPDATLAFVRATAEAGNDRLAVDLPRSVAVALVPCAAGDPERWVALLRAADDAYTDDLEHLPALVTHTGQAELIGDWLLAGEHKRVLAIAARHVLVQALGAGRRVTLVRARPSKTERHAGRPAAWMKRYPDRLRPVLRELAAVSPEAEQQAGRVLGTAFPDPAQLRREIDGLQARVSLAVPVQAATMRKRLASLRHRLGAPSKVSPARLAKFEAKLEARVRDCTLAAWEAELDRVAVPAIAAKVGAELPPDWVADTRRVRLLAQLAGLEPAFRNLAFSLVGARLGPPPWDLRDHPANLRWARAMERRGLRLDRWIEGPPPATVGGPDGTPVEIAFSDDPLEVFRMGEPFNTCLSPGDFNFFSTVAVAADLNKRVLYARDAAGAVIGRCLLAISTDGRLLAFHTYAHDGHWPFATHVRRWARTLARAVGTELAPSGTVQSLVAPEWYDDGPVDLTGRFRWSRDSSPFAKALPDMTVERFHEWIARIGGPGGLDTLTAPMLLGMYPLRSRPDLVATLLPALSAIEGLAPEQLLDAVNIVGHAPSWPGGEAEVPRDAVRPVVRRLMTGRFWRRSHMSWYAEQFVEAALMAGLPAEALQVLRQTRPRGVRSWDGEFADTRIYAAARAHDALQRPAVAWRLYDRLAREKYFSHTKQAHDHAKRRAAELAALLDR